MSKTAKSTATKKRTTFAGKKNSSPTSAVVELGEVKLSSITLSKRFNREHIDPTSDSFRDLVASVKVSGVIQPVLLRKIGSNGSNGSYELVAGERRMRAAKAAKRPTIPAIVRKADDLEAGDLQLVENLCREDLTPFEEAQQLKRQIDAGESTEDLAKRIGKTRRYVQRRVSIANLSPRWAKAARHPKLEVRNWPAMLLEMVAKLPVKAQDALSVGYNGGWDNQLRFKPYPCVEDLERTIGNLTRELKRAPWKRDDAELVAKAGACSSCERRGSCNPDLWDELAGAKTAADVAQRDVCLDQDCWDKKMSAYVASRANQLAEEHGKVVKISHSYAKKPPGAVNSHDVRECKKKAKGAIPAVVVDGKDAGRVCYVQPSPYSNVDSKIQTAPSKAKTRPLAERRAELNQKRAKVIRELLGAELEKAPIEAVVDALEPHPTLAGNSLCTRVLMSLVATFGARNWWDNADEDTTWIAFDSLCAGAEPAIHEHVWYDLRNRLSKVLGRGFSANVLVEPGQFKTDSERIAGIIGADLEQMRAAAAAKYPEPKSWAKEEAEAAMGLPGKAGK